MTTIRIPIDEIPAGTLRYGQSGYKRSATLANKPVQYVPRRIDVFRRNNSCVCCGKTITDVIIVPHPQIPKSHKLQFVHVDGVTGNTVEFTVDHILPKSMGGAYNMHNLQTMCFDCNGAKSDNMSEDEINTVLRNPANHCMSMINVVDVVDLLKDHLEFLKVHDTLTKKQRIRHKNDLIKKRHTIRRARMSAQPNQELQPNQQDTKGNLFAPALLIISSLCNMMKFMWNNG